MSGQRGEGRDVFGLNRSFHGQLFQAEACDLAAPAAAGGKGALQDRPVTDVA